VQQPRTTAPLRGDPRVGVTAALGVALRCLCVGFEGFAVGLLRGVSVRLHRALCALWLRRRAAGLASLTAQH
jgi:ATP:corrinoid adenosyltransferase